VRWGIISVKTRGRGVNGSCRCMTRLALGEVGHHLCIRGGDVKQINRSHTHAHRQRTTPPTPTHTHDKNNTPNREGDVNGSCRCMTGLALGEVGHHLCEDEGRRCEWKFSLYDKMTRLALGEVGHHLCEDEGKWCEWKLSFAPL